MIKAVIIATKSFKNQAFTGIISFSAGSIDSHQLFFEFDLTNDSELYLKLVQNVNLATSSLIITVTEKMFVEMGF